jgi:SAM-dependent methyltransferase
MKPLNKLLREDVMGYEPSPSQAELNAMGVKSEETQIETTISATIKPSLTAEELADGLEYGAGLCHGAKALGLESFEPYPKEKVSPTYRDITEIKKQYSLIICTYVLNVVGYDQRDIIISNIGRLLKPGGRAVIVVRGEEDVKSIKVRIASYGDAEFITKKGGKLTYQKGFTYSELANLCASVLGSGFTIAKFPGSNGKSVRVQIIKDHDDDAV